jgi:hypothetical protein
MVSTSTMPVGSLLQREGVKATAAIMSVMALPQGAARLWVTLLHQEGRHKGRQEEHPALWRHPVTPW